MGLCFISELDTSSNRVLTDALLELFVMIPNEITVRQRADGKVFKLHETLEACSRTRGAGGSLGLVISRIGLPG